MLTILTMDFFLNAYLYNKDEAVVCCLLVKCRKTGDGVLVVPDGAWVEITVLIS